MWKLSRVQSKKNNKSSHSLSLITQILFAVLISSVRARLLPFLLLVVNHSLLTSDYLFLECRVFFFSKIFKSTFLSRLCIEKYFLNLFLMGDFVVVVVVGGVVVVSSVLRLIFLCFIECVCVSV